MVIECFFQSLSILMLFEAVNHSYQVPYPSFFGFRYWVTFIDDYSRYRFVLPIKAKSDVFEAFKQFKAYAENQSERKIKILRDDKGGEYMSTLGCTSSPLSLLLRISLLGHIH